MIPTEKTHRVTYVDALGEALRDELRRDPTVLIMGSGLPRRAFGVPCEPLIKEFGLDRFVLTPVSEAWVTGTAVGAAMAGLRPVVDLGLPSFAWYAMDQLVNQAARNRHLFGGQTKVPAVFVMSISPGGASAAHHSDRNYPLFMHIPGFKVGLPSTPYDAKGLLKTAIRADDPVVMFLDNSPGAKFYGSHQQIPDEEYAVPFGQAVVRQEGTDVTLVSIGWLHRTMEAAQQLQKEGVSVEVIDPVSLKPLDLDTILESVARTGRLVVVDISHHYCGAAAEVAASVAEEAFRYLKAPVMRVTTPDVHIPAAPSLAAAIWPSKERIANTVRQCLDYS